MSESTRHIFKELSLLLLSAGSIFTAVCATKKFGDMQKENEKYGFPTFNSMSADLSDGISTYLDSSADSGE